MDIKELIREQDLQAYRVVGIAQVIVSLYRAGRVNDFDFELLEQELITLEARKQDTEAALNY